MAYRLIWAPAARQDLRELVAYISEYSPAAACKFARSLFRAVERLSQFPESGRIVPEFENKAIREIIRRPCRIVYRLRAREKEIQIARIWHAARGMPRL